MNPSLWLITLYNKYAGLFDVCGGIYQVRGYDSKTYLKNTAVVNKYINDQTLHYINLEYRGGDQQHAYAA